MLPSQTKVRTWTPAEGPFHGFLITHNEAISIADFFTLRDESGALVYRPTVHYAYHPCDAAVASLHELAGKNYEPQGVKRLVVDEARERAITTVIAPPGARRLTLKTDAFLSASCTDRRGDGRAGRAPLRERARRLLARQPAHHPRREEARGQQQRHHAAGKPSARFESLPSRIRCSSNNGLILPSALVAQVTATVLGGLIWAIENPNRGIVEPEEVQEWRRILVR